MDHVLPDAFDASQQGIGFGTRHNSEANIQGRVKVDGMYRLGQYVLRKESSKAS